MIYGVEQSTDQRCKQTKIKKFTSKIAANKWAKHSGNYTHDDPESARNYHHTFRSLYDYSGRINKKDDIFKDNGSRDYPRSEADKLAHYLWKYGIEIKD